MGRISIMQLEELDNEPVKEREARIQYSKITTLKKDSKDYQFLSENHY